MIKSLNIAALLVFFLAASWPQEVVAQAVAPTVCVVPCTPATPACASSCSSTGTANSIGSDMRSKFEEFLKNSAEEVERHVADKVDDIVEIALDSINETELRLIDWWKGMWADKLFPDMQNIVKQLNVANADQSRTLQSGVDSYALSQNQQVRQENELQNHRDVRTNDSVGTIATLAGGFSRANNFAQKMRNGWQREIIAVGLNRKGTPGAAGRIEAEARRYDDFKNIFCDPAGNNGTNDCAATDARFYNADTQPSKFVYDRLTIDVKNPADAQHKMAKAVATIQNNLMGVPAAEPISLGALKSSAGQQTYLARRSYLARYAAVSSVPQLETSWRMPGSQMGQWIRSLREQTGAPAANIAENPSYREVMHAASIDRVNSGRYAVGMVTDEGQLEMEKLTIDALYLMQLRDYYELLERTALTLAVQVSMMADEAPLPDVVSSMPLNSP